MSESKSRMLTALAQHTGLDRNTIKDLIKKGWTFENYESLMIFKSPKAK